MIDELCTYTGMKRSGPIRQVDRWDTGINNERSYKITVPLDFDGSIRSFVVTLGARRQLCSFGSGRADFSRLKGRLGESTIMSPDIRSRCRIAVARIAKHYHRHLYGKGGVQQFGRNYLVTYLTVSEERAVDYIDPCVSFIVTPKGTTIAIVDGA